MAGWGGGIYSNSGNNNNSSNSGSNNNIGSNNNGGNTNNNWTCPPGSIPVFIPYIGFICIPPLYVSGGGSGGTNGEMETIISNSTTGGRISEEDCIDLTKGIGIVTNPDSKIVGYASTNDPVTTQISNCLNNSAIEAKIAELSSQKLYDPCSGQEIFVNTVDLALDLCFGGGKDGVGLTPESLEDAYYEALDGVDYINIPLSQFDDCPLMKCLLKNLKDVKLGDSLSNRICSIFQPAVYLPG